MAFMFATSPCLNCKKLFSYSPSLVPSLRVNGHREPVCKSCIDNANPIRVRNGLEPINVKPGAYEPEECA